MSTSIATLKTLKKQLLSALSDKVETCDIAFDELTLRIDKENLLDVCAILKKDFKFEMLIDIAGIDYLHFGQTEWKTTRASATGFSRATRPLRMFSTKPGYTPKRPQRFCVAYHLLSIRQNIRMTIKVFLADEENPSIDSVMALWPTANWHEREAYDMFGILFKNHEDLRRILTDYNFEGYPFRKDFPLEGYVEMRFDNEKDRIVYEPVEIKPRVLVPKVIREDSRYLDNPDTKHSLTKREDD